MAYLDTNHVIKILTNMPRINLHLAEVEKAAIREAVKFMEANKPRVVAGSKRVRSYTDLEKALEVAHTKNAVLRSRNKQIEKELSDGYRG